VISPNAQSEDNDRPIAAVSITRATVEEDETPEGEEGEEGAEGEEGEKAAGDAEGGDKDKEKDSD